MKMLSISENSDKLTWKSYKWLWNCLDIPCLQNLLGYLLIKFIMVRVHWKPCSKDLPTFAEINFRFLSKVRNIISYNLVLVLKPILVPKQKENKDSFLNKSPRRETSCCKKLLKILIKCLTIILVSTEGKHTYPCENSWCSFPQ